MKSNNTESLRISRFTELLELSVQSLKKDIRENIKDHGEMQQAMRNR